VHVFDEKPVFVQLGDDEADALGAIVNGLAEYEVGHGEPDVAFVAFHAVGGVDAFVGAVQDFGED